MIVRTANVRRRTSMRHSAAQAGAGNVKRDGVCCAEGRQMFPRRFVPAVDYALYGDITRQRRSTLTSRIVYNSCLASQTPAPVHVAWRLIKTRFPFPPTTAATPLWSCEKYGRGTKENRPKRARQSSVGGASESGVAVGGRGLCLARARSLFPLSIQRAHFYASQAPLISHPRFGVVMSCDT